MKKRDVGQEILMSLKDKKKEEVNVSSLNFPQMLKPSVCKWV